MNNNELTEISKEILDYSHTMPDCSYYDLKAYAYRERPEWVPAFEDRKTQRFLGLYLKSKKHSTKTPYIHTTAQAMENAVDAAAEYYHKKADES